MRRGSLVGPFVLILVGVVLLINNLEPELSLFRLFLQYWPFLLVGWGALRLVEILVSAARSHSLPPNGITTGEWVLAILLCLLASGAEFAHSHLPKARITMHGLQLFGEAFDYPLAGSVEAGPAPHVFIENLRGNVRVVGGEGSQVKVEGRAAVRAFAREDADRINAQCPLEIARQGDQIIIRTNQERAGGEWNVSADLEISVPKGASVAARGRYGDFDVANIDGDVEIESDNAGVRLASIGGDARIKLERSDIIRIVSLKGKAEIKGRGEDIDLQDISGRVTINGAYSGELSMRNLAAPLVFQSRRTDLRVERVPGVLVFDLGDLSAEDVEGPIRLKTSSRDVQLSRFSGPLEIDIERGDVELRPKERSPQIHVSLHSGDIVLVLPEGTEAGIEAVTRRGEVINEFGQELTAEELGQKGARLFGPAGKPVRIRLSTRRGDITVRKAAAVPGEDSPKRLKTTSV